MGDDNILNSTVTCIREPPRLNDALPPFIHSTAGSGSEYLAPLHTLVVRGGLGH